MISSRRNAARSARSTRLVGLGLVLAASSAEADSLNGIAANEKSYVVGPTRVCTPLVVTAGVAKGMPACHTAPTDEVAGLSTRMPSADRGPKAELVAKAKGRTITVETKAGAAVLAWDAPDPVASIVDVWRSPTERIVIVEYAVRRAGREVHDVVGFDRGVGRGGEAVITAPVTPVTPPVAPTADTAVAKLAAKARKTHGKAAVKAWTAVLAADAAHAEAHYRIAVAEVAAKRTDAALTRLEILVASPRPDAIEWLIEARTERAFAKLVGDARFRAAVGFDRPPTTTYERVMGLGGLWEQAIVPCDRPEMKLTFSRDRKLTLMLRTSCSGMREKVTYRGTWDAAGDLVHIKLPKLDAGDDIAPCALTADGDEDVLRCQIDQDLGFEARPVRR